MSDIDVALHSALTLLVKGLNTLDFHTKIELNRTGS